MPIHQPRLRKWPQDALIFQSDLYYNQSYCSRFFLSPIKENKQTKTRRISPLPKNVWLAAHQPSLPRASCTPRNNRAPSEPGALWVPFGTDVNSRSSRSRMRSRGGRGGTGCFLVCGERHQETQVSSFAHPLRGWSICLCYCCFSTGRSSAWYFWRRQHKNHVNVIPQRELAAQSLSATQVFCP